MRISRSCSRAGAPATEPPLRLLTRRAAPELPGPRAFFMFSPRPIASDRRLGHAEHFLDSGAAFAHLGEAVVA
ncbi:MAG: hypothetical protein ACK56F_00780, partial [bacterium]